MGLSLFRQMSWGSVGISLSQHPYCPVPAVLCSQQLTVSLLKGGGHCGGCLSLPPHPAAGSRKQLAEVCSNSRGDINYTHSLSPAASCPIGVLRHLHCDPNGTLKAVHICRRALAKPPVIWCSPAKKNMKRNDCIHPEESSPSTGCA